MPAKSDNKHNLGVGLSPLIELREFTCIRNEEPLFQPLSLQVVAGSAIQVTGPNGAGKTTFLRALAGLFEQFTGDYLWQGRPIGQMRFERAEAMLYLGHQPGIKASLSPLENLRWSMGMRGHPAPDLTSALAEVGLAGFDDTPCHQMSAGQQRRVALARLHLTSARLWVLDEPFTAIDTAGVKKLEALIDAHLATGGAVIITSHQPVAVTRLTPLALRRMPGEAA